VSSSKADSTARLPIVVLLSGAGTNFAAIAAASAAGRLPVEIRAVLSDQPAAQGLVKARALGIAAESLAPAAYADAAAYNAALAARILAFAPRLVVLAGYMRVLSAAAVARFAGRMLNIHPSLLPALRGLHTHRRALESGAAWHGCSVHFVNEQLDGGPVIAQARVAVREGETEAGLAARVRAREHVLYPLVIGWFASGRLGLENDRALLDGRVLEKPVVLEETDATS
jgi:phosphoribosylglycinamide formyltransferase-1